MISKKYVGLHRPPTLTHKVGAKWNESLHRTADRMEHVPKRGKKKLVLKPVVRRLAPAVRTHADDASWATDQLTDIFKAIKIVGKPAGTGGRWSRGQLHEIDEGFNQLKVNVPTRRRAKAVDKTPGAYQVDISNFRRGKDTNTYRNGMRPYYKGRRKPMLGPKLRSNSNFKQYPNGRPVKYDANRVDLKKSIGDDMSFIEMPGTFTDKPETREESLTSLRTRDLRTGRFVGAPTLVAKAINIPAWKGRPINVGRKTGHVLDAAADVAPYALIGSGLAAAGAAGTKKKKKPVVKSTSAALSGAAWSLPVGLFGYDKAKSRREQRRALKNMDLGVTLKKKETS